MDTSQIQQILHTELQKLSERISSNIDATGRKATGKTQASLAVEVEGLSGALMGREAFATLEQGSRPWVKQYTRPPKWFAELIQEWIKAKRLDLNAYAVARTLMRDGSKLRREGGASDVYTHEIPEAVDRIQAQIADAAQTLIADRLTLRDTTI